jgi:hypothetical protein
MSAPDPATATDTEAAARAVAAAALDIEAVAGRAARSIERLEDRGDPNAAVALRRAVESLHDVSATLRRDGLLQSDQYKLL